MSRSPFDYPFDIDALLRKKQQLKADLLTQENLIEKKIAVLEGSTSAELVDQLELFLLATGVKPVFYRSEYNKYYEEAIFPTEELISFSPDIVYIYTSAVNLMTYPAINNDKTAVENLLQDEIKRYDAIWQGIQSRLGCPVLQNNFDLPWCRPLGNLDGSDYRGRVLFIEQLNVLMAQQIQENNNVYLFDLHYLSARHGIDNWFNPRLWYLYKYAVDLQKIPFLAHALVATLNGIWGRNYKCLVTDLDNTLWGGMIGDDGVDGIVMGGDNAEGEAYTDYQRYIKALHERGVILATASKNDKENALAGLRHPDCLVKETDFAAMSINWEPKFLNIQKLAAEISIGEDAMAFVDDSPVERDSVRVQLPHVAVPEIGDDISDYVRLLDQSALFEVASLSADDIQRNQQYQSNLKRRAKQAQYASYEEYLASLNMKAEIVPFNTHNGLYLERICQLVNKTNQFNLTTQRCSQAEIESIASDERCLTLYGRLEDKFGDNGLVSVMAGEIEGDELTIFLWLMSCRVLKRGMEYAMFTQFCKQAEKQGLIRLRGVYIPTAKNNMVADLYSQLGFVEQPAQEREKQCWQLDLPAASVPDFFIELVN